ncbi:hypothetical protein HK107_13795 [Parvularcula sp. ZS-1/3]|uniref:DUF2946 domain-containing protein n=1 Tax=Parvularcula mediterranea TaxID=2732508 RepID=A0A7Y3RPG4_9PROT|nr:hypothetical protein [Parvularcula mediterranea]NNU17400.1 hypothetical protein [Parvularcula mediterranea]
MVNVSQYLRDPSGPLRALCAGAVLAFILAFFVAAEHDHDADNHAVHLGACLLCSASSDDPLDVPPESGATKPATSLLPAELAWSVQPCTEASLPDGLTCRGPPA